MNLVSFARPEQASLLHQAPMRLRHTLSDHPLFRLDRLVKLAQSLPRDRIE